MLNQRIFKDGLKKLVNEYGSKGFEVTKERAAQWYEYMKHLSDNQFNAKIDNCIKMCKHVPYMSDVLDIKQEYVDTKASKQDFDFTGL